MATVCCPAHCRGSLWSSESRLDGCSTDFGFIGCAFYVNTGYVRKSGGDSNVLKLCFEIILTQLHHFILEIVKSSRIFVAFLYLQTSGVITHSWSWAPSQLYPAGISEDGAQGPAFLSTPGDFFFLCPAKSTGDIRFEKTDFWWSVLPLANYVTL